VLQAGSSSQHPGVISTISSYFLPIALAKCAIPAPPEDFQIEGVFRI
jgi:hypothetical protein